MSAIIYSDNIAFIKLKERVGQAKFVTYLKSLGAAYTYPGGWNTTSADDLSLYTQELFRYQGIVRMERNCWGILNILSITLLFQKVYKGKPLHIKFE